jgi:hypothetical protein
MVLTAAQITAFFTDADQMGLPNPTMVKLQEEGINEPSNLADFDEETLKKAATNLRNPGDRIPNPDENATAGSTIPRPPYVFGAQSQKRLMEAGELIRFYETIGRTLTAANIKFDPIIKDFTKQWKALTSRKDDDSPDVPIISKALPVIKWTEAFDDFLSRTIGVRMIPLSYVTREKVEVPAACPALKANKPHSELHGSVELDLVNRASHDDPLYDADNTKVYFFLEEATRGTQYAASIKPYQRSKDGRGALMSIRNQYAGRDKWEAELKKQDELIHNRVWKGQSNYSLEKFIAHHRNAYVSMQQCAEHVAFQLPNDHTRVGFLLDGIQSSDAGLNAAIAQIKADDGDGGKRKDFEATASFLLPYDPVAKKQQSSTKRDHDSMVSDVTAKVSSTFGNKSGLGKSGVHLRYHTTEEYKALSKEQRLELKEWRQKNGKDKKGTNTNEKSPKKSVTKKLISAITKEVSKQLKGKDKVNDNDDLDGIIMSLQSTSNADESEKSSKKARFVEDPTTKVSTSALKSIIRRARNSADQNK